MRHLCTALSAALLISAGAPGHAVPESVQSMGCGDLQISIDRALSVTCEIANTTGRAASAVRAKVEYLAAEELGPIASHVVDAYPYGREGIPAYGHGPVPFEHPPLPRAYLEFRDPIIRVKILEAWDANGERIFPPEAARAM